MSKTNIHRYTDEEINFLRLITPGKSTYEITELFNKKFDLNLKRSQIRGVMKNRKITSGLQTTFRIGMDPWNKGTKGLTKPNKTSFKKGHINHNKLPIGTEVMGSDGYLKIKIGNPNYWIQSHRLNYMRNHGPIPKGMKIIFLDQNRRNLSPDNLFAVTAHELQILNKKRLLYNDKALSKTGAFTAKLIAATNKKSRGMKI